MELKQVAHSQFHQLFSEDGVTDISVELEFLSNIPALVFVETNAGLIKPFYEQEVVDVIWGMEPD